MDAEGYSALGAELCISPAELLDLLLTQSSHFFTFHRAMRDTLHFDMSKPSTGKYFLIILS